MFTNDGAEIKIRIYSPSDEITFLMNGIEFEERSHLVKQYMRDRGLIVSNTLGCVPTRVWKYSWWNNYLISHYKEPRGKPLYTAYFSKCNFYGDENRALKELVQMLNDLITVTEVTYREME
jgi:hypothetical protein